MCETVTLLPDEVAKVIRMTRTQVVRHIRNGVLPGRKVGGRWRVLESDLLSFLSERSPGGDHA